MDDYNAVKKAVSELLEESGKMSMEEIEDFVNGHLPIKTGQIKLEHSLKVRREYVKLCKYMLNKFEVMCFGEEAAKDARMMVCELLYEEIKKNEVNEENC